MTATALITGGTGGLGSAVSAAFLRDGWRVVVPTRPGESSPPPRHEEGVELAALGHLVSAGGGAIVCVSSRAAVQPFSGAAGYISAKASVIAFAQAVAVEYRAEGVRCNAVLPSVIDTPANRASQPDADPSRWVAPDRIASVIRFLCSAEAEATSGAAVPVYGRA